MTLGRKNYKIIRKPNNLIIIGNLSFQLLQYVSKSVFVSICVFLHLKFYIFEFVTPLGHKKQKIPQGHNNHKTDRHRHSFRSLRYAPIYSFHPFSRFYLRVIYRICNFDRDNTNFYCTTYIVQNVDQCRVLQRYSCRTVI